MTPTCAWPAREAGVNLMVTFNYFTLPAWFARDGARHNPDAPAVFAGYCAVVAAHFGDAVTWYSRLNEPNLGALMTMGGTVPMAAMEDVGAASRIGPEAQEEFARRVGGTVGTARTGQHDPDRHSGAHQDGHGGPPAGSRGDQPGPLGPEAGWTLAPVDLQAADGAAEIVRPRSGRSAVPARVTRGRLHRRPDLH
ncbi:family 1 glycosylhydrolase [Streptomyces phaeochromogenes]|uniref:family 1 glycosylhydrolase n=1 Tax=Streptomyces phaeochromogenes TaxID=1923 RepID=UPI00368E9C60